MKTMKHLVLCALVLTFAINLKTYAQDAQDAQEEFKPVYITITTTYWNDDPDTDFSDWLATEKEYFEKVTMKNDLVIGSGFYTHLYTENSMEVVLVNVYANWNDIEKSNDVNSKLLKEGWADDEARKAFLAKQSGYYSKEHSDEIYVSTPFNRPLTEKSDEPLIYYVRKSELAMDGQGSSKDFKEFFENITMKNDVLKGYHSHRHLWGSDGREFSEVFVFESMDDIKKGQDATNELIEAYWPDEEKRKAFFKKFNKIFTGKHGDLIYQSVPELAK